MPPDHVVERHSGSRLVQASLRVSPETDGPFFREGEAPAEPQRDDSATAVAIRSPAGADLRDPVEQTRPVRSACGSAGASPSPSALHHRRRVSGKALTPHADRCRANASVAFPSGTSKTALTTRCGSGCPGVVKFPTRSTNCFTPAVSSPMVTIAAWLIGRNRAIGQQQLRTFGFVCIPSGPKDRNPEMVNGTRPTTSHRCEITRCEITRGQRQHEQPARCLLPTIGHPEASSRLPAWACCRPLSVSPASDPNRPVHS